MEWYKKLKTPLFTLLCLCYIKSVHTVGIGWAR